MKQVEDSEILQKFSQERTRNEAFNLLLNKYQQKIYWHIRRLVINHDDADDLVQAFRTCLLKYGRTWAISEAIRNYTPGYTE
jgi:DNA-directed RNA polymerase specialized sigma24 family protein